MITDRIRRARRARTIGVHLLALAALACGERGEAPHATAGDDRRALEVSPEVRDAIRAEMRTMLGSLNAMLAGIAAGDTGAVAGAAAASGLATAADPALERVLPEEFLRLGMGTHARFDSLAAAVRAGMPVDSVVPRLAGITDNCVACHSTYRLEVR